MCFWKTKQLNIGGTNLTNVQYANIDNQGKFIDTMKYHQQSLSPLAKNASEIEKKSKRASCLKFIEKNETYSATFNSSHNNYKNWILDYLWGGKWVIPYEKNQNPPRLRISSRKWFFSNTEFYSSLKNEIINDESYENVKQFRKLLRLKKPLELNDIYNFQNTIIFCEIFENKAREMMRKFPYNPRKCTSASSLSGCIHRFLLKSIITLPTQAEIVD